jgi:transposase
MSAHLDVGERWRVISMKLDQGMSTRQIAGIIKCSTHTVYNILNLFRQTDDVVERRGRGGRNSLTTEERRVLRQLFYNYRTETSARINDRFSRRTGRFISSRTIRNYRRSLGFHPVHARTQPLINSGHAEQRFFFSQQHIDDDWSRIIFSDEKAFEVDVSGIVYWIPYGRPRPTSFTSQVQFRIAVFGAVWYNSKSDLVLIRGRTNTATFVEYLRAAFRSHRRSIKNYSFIHDRPRWAHTSSAH